MTWRALSVRPSGKVIIRGRESEPALAALVAAGAVGGPGHGLGSVAWSGAGAAGVGGSGGGAGAGSVMAAARAAAAAQQRHHVAGVSFLLVGCVSMALYLTLQQRVLAKHPQPQAVTCWSYAIGAALMVVAALALEPPWDPLHAAQW
jgi:drug/metabolite transporter (DMT)-like permease